VAGDINFSKQQLDGMTFISLVFGPALGWEWVATNTDTSAQLLAYTPLVLQNALGLTRTFFFRRSHIEARD
jgi:hypothetical protein